MESPVPTANTKVFARVLPWAGFPLVAIFFVVMKSFAFHWQVGDENVYFYMAWAAAEQGAWPYADFFFAHPPMHILPGIGLALIGSFVLPYPFIFLLPITMTACSLLLLFKG